MQVRYRSAPHPDTDNNDSKTTKASAIKHTYKNAIRHLDTHHAILWNRHTVELSYTRVGGIMQELMNRITEYHSRITEIMVRL